MPHESHIDGLDWIVEVSNEFGTVPRAVAGESSQPFAAPVAQLPNWASVLSDGSMVLVADTWFAIIQSVGEARADLCNRALLEAPLTPHVRHDEFQGMTIEWRASAGASDVDRLVAHGAAVIAEALSLDPAVLGQCDARDCCDVFIDRSPRRNRSFCCVRCQGTTRVRRYRARHVIALVARLSQRS